VLGQACWPKVNPCNMMNAWPCFHLVPRRILGVKVAHDEYHLEIVNCEYFTADSTKNSLTIQWVSIYMTWHGKAPGSCFQVGGSCSHSTV